MDLKEIIVSNPATGEIAGAVRVSAEKEVSDLAAKARRAQRDWASLALGSRARYLVRFHDLVLERKEQILDTIQSETGKSRRDAFTEITSIAVTARYYAYHGPRHIKERRHLGALPGLLRARVRWIPHRLVGLITPWNYPFLLAIGDALPALLGGSGVLIKPSERTPLSAELARKLLLETGLDPNLLGLVHGHAQQASWVIRHVDYVAFTGGSEAGRAVALAAAARAVGCSLELGGKNPMVVLGGSDPRSAADGLVTGAFANSGQACIGLERVYVVESLYDRFVSAAVERMENLRLGWSRNWSIDVGSLIGPDHLDRVMQHVYDAVAKGAVAVAGGRKRPDLGPAFMEPTLLTGVPDGSVLSLRETFGPVVSVYPVRTAEEAIARANQSPYGLNASIWGPTGRRALALARQIETGSAGVHTTLEVYGSLDVPMGGVKGSGLGRRHGADGIRRFAQPQSIVTSPRLLGGYDSLWTHLESPRIARIIGGLLRVWRHIPGLR